MQMMIGDNTAKWLNLCKSVELMCAFCGRSKRQTKRYMWHFHQAYKANDFEAVERLKEKIIEDSIVFGEGKKNENADR